MSGVTRMMVVMVVAGVVAVTAAQTFQYSRGWTNGRKRSDGGGIVRSAGGGLPLILAGGPPSSSSTSTASHLRHPPSSLLVTSSHQTPKTIEERLRVLEAGLGAIIKASSSANFSPGGDDEYYTDN